MNKLCALCVKELQNFIFCLKLWILNHSGLVRPPSSKEWLLRNCVSHHLKGFSGIFAFSENHDSTSASHSVTKRTTPSGTHKARILFGLCEILLLKIKSYVHQTNHHGDFYQWTDNGSKGFTGVHAKYGYGDGNSEFKVIACSSE